MISSCLTIQVSTFGRHKVKMKKFLVVCLCIAFGRVSCDVELRMVGEKKADVFVETLDGARFPPLVPSHDAKMIFHPGERLQGVSDVSLPIIFRRSVYAAPSGMIRSPRRSLKTVNVTESSLGVGTERSAIYLEESDKQFLTLEKNSRNFSTEIADTFDPREENYHAGRKLLRTRKMINQSAVERSREYFDSRSKWNSVLRLIPESLKSTMADTDSLEDKLLVNLVLKGNINKTLTEEIKKSYRDAQREERWLLKNLIDGSQNKSEAALLTNNYKTLRSGVVWNYTKFDPVYSEFFNTPSDVLNEYIALKASESDVDSYLGGQLKYPDKENYDKTMRAKEEYKNLSKSVGKAGDVTEPSSKPPTNATDEKDASLSVRMSLAAMLPRVLKDRIEKTDEIERELLRGSDTSPNLPVDILSLYEVRRKEERMVLKRALKECGSYAPDILQIYKAIRKGVAWKYAKLNDSVALHKPTEGAAEYELLKKDELASVDAFLSSTDGNEAVDAVDNNTSNTKAAESKSVFESLLGELPDLLQRKMESTDAAEKKLLDDYARTQGVSEKSLGVYGERKKDERQLLKQVVKVSGSYGSQFLKLYKAIRKGRAWTYQVLDDASKRFFQKSSPALTQYETLKRDELTSLDAFLMESSTPFHKGEEEMSTSNDALKAIVEEEDEETGESGRKGRDDIIGEQFRTDEVTNVENDAAGDDADVTTMEVEGVDGVILWRPDDVTTADNSLTGNQGEDHSNSRLLRVFVRLSVPINATLAILVVCMYRKDLVRLYKKRRASKATTADGEQERLRSDEPESSG